jgi:hypothetical protein
MSVVNDLFNPTLAAAGTGKETLFELGFVTVAALTDLPLKVIAKPAFVFKQLVPFGKVMRTVAPTRISEPVLCFVLHFNV